MSLLDDPIYKRFIDRYNNKKLPSWTPKALRNMNDDQLADYARKKRNNVAAQELVKDERVRRETKSKRRWSLFLAILGAIAIIVAAIISKNYKSDNPPNKKTETNSVTIKP